MQKENETEIQSDEGNLYFSQSNEESDDIERINQVDEILPVVPMRGFVMFPRMLLNFELTRDESIMAVQKAMKSGQKVLIVCQTDILNDKPSGDDLYKIGIIVHLKQIVHKQGIMSTRVMAEGIKRARVIKYIDDLQYMMAQIEPCEEIYCEQTPEITALVRKIRDLFDEYLEFSSKIPGDLLIGSRSIDDPGEVADYIASNASINMEIKQKILEELDGRKRAELLGKELLNEINLMKIEEDILTKLKDSTDKSQRDYILREQMKVISHELGEDDNPQIEALEYKNKLKKLKLPKKIFEALSKECNRFAKIPEGSIEANISRNYIDICVNLPWNKKTKDNIDIVKAREILDNGQYGLDEVKDRIIEILAVRKLSKTLKGQIICLEGPPGVGKTSIAKFMAEAMGRKFERVSLGGVKDESEIRGHRRTYVGAMPGRIVSAIKRSGVKNPLVLLDEIDKLSSDYHGDPSAALLEVLDPEQNNTFYDHYIDLPFDLSEVLFITTANDHTRIPKPLYDRMEIINLYSYTHQEKFNIAKIHLIKNQIKKNGLNENEFSIDDEALHILIEGYTKEAGVRGLEKRLSSLMRKVAKKIVSGEVKSVHVNKYILHEMLGPRAFKGNIQYERSEIGVVKGLAWTAVGGETMPIEVSLMKGKGKVQVTGSLGDVMKESAQIAVSYIRSNSENLGIKNDFYTKTDIHIHAPEGAVPKDGPSAGVTITTALVSALSGIPVRQDIAMTGEVTLKGKVLAIGGLKEKTMAAYRDGVQSVIIPSENESDLEKIDKEVKKSIHFIMADNLDTVLKNSLDFTNKKIGTAVNVTVRE